MAEENPKEDIQKSAEFPWLILGDGCEALWQGATERKDLDTGRTVIDATIKPTSSFKKINNITPDMLNKNGQMNITFAKDDLIHLNEFNPFVHKIIYTKSYKHEDTPLSLREKDLQTKSAGFQKTIWTNEGSIIKLSDELDTAKNNPIELFARDFEILEKFNNATGGNRRQPEE